MTIARANAWKYAPALALTFLFGACHNTSVAPAETPQPPIESVLRGSSALTGGCYEFPPTDPTHTDHVTLGVSTDTGDAAIDFTLKDTAGLEHRLSDLLETRPVVLLFGAFS